MLIKVEVTPNPAARRFLLPRPLPLEAPAAFDRSSDQPPRFAERLFDIRGVTELLFARDFVSVSRDATADPWSDLLFEIVGAISEALAEGEDPELKDWAQGNLSSDDPVEEQIAELLRTRIAPRIARDGGSITLLSYSGRLATVEIRGACGGCPSAPMTLKRAVRHRRAGTGLPHNRAVRRSPRPGCR
jgi:Fe-S cluster biogenesis protein NfuA